MLTIEIPSLDDTQDLVPRDEADRSQLAGPRTFSERSSAWKLDSVRECQMKRAGNCSEQLRPRE